MPRFVTRDLTQEEVAEELEKYSTVVDDFIAKAREAGNALRIIQEKKLYRYWYKTFSDYTKARWNMSADVARQYIGYSRVVSILMDADREELIPMLTVTNTQVISKKVKPEKVVEIIDKATEGGTKIKVTKKEVREEVAKINDDKNIKNNIKNNINDIISDDDIDEVAKSIDERGRALGDALDALYDLRETIGYLIEVLHRYENRDRSIYKEIAKFGKNVDKAMGILKITEEDNYETARKKYLAIAREVHPDKGGSDKAMQEVNEAFKLIKEWKQWKRKN